MSHGANWPANFWGRFQNKSSWAGNNVLRALGGGYSLSSTQLEAGKPPTGYCTVPGACRRGDPRTSKEKTAAGEMGHGDLGSWHQVSPMPPLLSTYCVQAQLRHVPYPQGSQANQSNSLNCKLLRFWSCLHLVLFIVVSLVLELGLRHSRCSINIC